MQSNEEILQALASKCILLTESYVCCVFFMGAKLILIWFPHHVLQVIRLLGVCTQGEELMMILELAARGDLKNFLRDCRPNETNAGLLSIRHRIKMAMDVANGMKFLSELSFVHRDLACRYVSFFDRCMHW